MTTMQNFVSAMEAVKDEPDGIARVAREWNDSGAIWPVSVTNYQVGKKDMGPAKILLFHLGKDDPDRVPEVAIIFGATEEVYTSLGRPVDQQVALALCGWAHPEVINSLLGFPEKNPEASEEEKQTDIALTVLTITEALQRIQDKATHADNHRVIEKAFKYVTAAAARAGLDRSFFLRVLKKEGFVVDGWVDEHTTH